MKDKKGRVLSRREFAQRAALLSATASLASAEAVLPASLKEPSPQAASSTPKLSDAGQAEAESHYQRIMVLYGGRFDEQQKADLKRMCAELQPSLDHIRSFALQNADAPALYLKPLVEREKKPPSTAAHTSKQS
jgi:hypothetical protein